MAVLDLGGVGDIARVFLNGREVVVSWKPPHRLDISAHLRAGINTLEIRSRIVINRLIGDEAVENGLEFQRRSINRFTEVARKDYEADSPLVQSDLLGPVKIERPNRDDLI